MLLQFALSIAGKDERKEDFETALAEGRQILALPQEQVVFEEMSCLLTVGVTRLPLASITGSAVTCSILWSGEANLSGRFVMPSSSLHLLLQKCSRRDYPLPQEAIFSLRRTDLQVSCPICHLTYNLTPSLQGQTGGSCCYFGRLEAGISCL